MNICNAIVASTESRRRVNVFWLLRHVTSRGSGVQAPRSCTAGASVRSPATARQAPPVKTRPSNPTRARGVFWSLEISQPSFCFSIAHPPPSQVQTSQFSLDTSRRKGRARILSNGVCRPRPRPRPQPRPRSTPRRGPRPVRQGRPQVGPPAPRCHSQEPHRKLPRRATPTLPDRLEHLGQGARLATPNHRARWCSILPPSAKAGRGATGQELGRRPPASTRCPRHPRPYHQVRRQARLQRRTRRYPTGPSQSRCSGPVCPSPSSACSPT